MSVISHSAVVFRGPDIQGDPTDAIAAAIPAAAPADKSKGCGLSLTLTLAAALLGGAIGINNGRLHWLGLQWLALGLLVMAVGLIRSRSKLLTSVREPVLVAALGATIAFQLAHLAAIGVITAAESNLPIAALRACLGVMAMGILIGAVFKRHILGALLLLSGFAVAGWACLWTTPHVLIDVMEFQRESSALLISGENPYHARYRNIYPSAEFYGPGVVQGPWLTYSFPYPPLSLLMAAPAQVLVGDVRYAHLAALVGAGAVLILLTRSRIGLLAAAMLLTSPRALYVVQSAWTEPFLILLAAVLAYFAVRGRLIWLGIGLLLAVKQYLVLLIPLTRLLGPTLGSRSAWRQTMLAGALLAAGTIVPFFALDPAAFLRGVVQWQLVQPFRYDALSFPAMYAQLGGGESGGLSGFLAAGLATALGLWRAPRNVGGFTAAAALVFCCFFAFNKQAFCNYYLFVIGLCCTAVAALSVEAGEDDNSSGVARSGR